MAVWAIPQCILPPVWPMVVLREVQQVYIGSVPLLFLIKSWVTLKNKHVCVLNLFLSVLHVCLFYHLCVSLSVCLSVSEKNFKQNGCTYLNRAGTDPFDICDFRSKSNMTSFLVFLSIYSSPLFFFYGSYFLHNKNSKCSIRMPQYKNDISFEVIYSFSKQLSTFGWK